MLIDIRFWLIFLSSYCATVKLLWSKLPQDDPENCLNKLNLRTKLYRYNFISLEPLAYTLKKKKKHRNTKKNTLILWLHLNYDFAM